MYSELQVKKQGKRSWVLTKDWTTPYGTVPKGFKSDGVTVPRVFWWFIPPAGSLFEAAIIHDYLYVYGVGSKTFADIAFKQTATYHQATTLEITISFYVVSIFGRGNFKE